MVGDAWQYDFIDTYGITCTVNETDQGDAVLVRYSCDWTPGDQKAAATLNIENAGCPGESAGPSFYPDESGTVTLEGCGDSGVLTVYNDLFDPDLPNGTPGTPPSGNPPGSPTTPVTPVTPVTRRIRRHKGLRRLRQRQ